jgi:hypothetical protein
VADVVRPSNFPSRLAGIAPLQGLALLVGGELRLAAHLHAAGLGEPPAFAVARADKLALKLGQSAQDGQHQAAVRCSGVGPGTRLSRSQWDI